MKKGFLLISAFVLIIGCTNTNRKNPHVEDSDFEVNVTNDEIKNRDSHEAVVFYNIFSPVDLENIVTEKNSFFNSNYLNSIDNLTSYTESYKIALNVGIYGADLSYLWVFEQTQQALSYLAAIQHLTDKLGIPKDFVDFTASSIETNAQDLDTIASIARDAYHATDRYLKGSERENIAVFILLGGWIETLYIATQVYKKTDPVLAGKIATQKYSLNSLITMMQNYQDDLVMSEYLLLFKKLNEAFTVFEKQLKPENITIDTINKHISIKENSGLEISPDQLIEIKELTSKIRNRMVN